MPVKTIVQINKAAKSKPSVRSAISKVNKLERDLKAAKKTLKSKRIIEVKKLVAVNKREIKKRDAKKKKCKKRATKRKR